MINHQKDGRISAETLEGAIAEDINWILPRIQYRGRTVSNVAFQAWAKQFPADIRAIPVHIVREIAERYYIGTAQYFESLDDLIAQSGVERRDFVTFCKWQCLGRSASRVAHDLKNQGRWRPLEEIDLDANEADWPDLSAHGGCRWAIVADDFVGSGRTISKLFRSPSPIDRVLAKYPQIKIRILLVAGFETGLRKVQSLIGPYRDRVGLVVSRLLRDEDRCFVPGNRIFSDAAQSERVRRFCIEVARTHYPGLPADMRLGHSEIGALAVFFDTVPNNSLPILWHDEGTWLPLFPASGLPRGEP